MPTTSCLSVVSISLATAVCARPWCASPQPVTPSSLVALTSTASRFTAVPMPSATRSAGAIGNETGWADSSAMRNAQRLRIDEVARRLAVEHAQHFFGGGDAHARARLARHAGEMRGEDHVVEREQRVSGLEPVMLVDVEHRACQAPFTQSRYQGFLLHDGTAADVDEPSGAFHRSQSVVIEQMTCFRRERASDHHEVALPKEFIQRGRRGFGGQA